MDEEDFQNRVFILASEYQRKWLYSPEYLNGSLKDMLIDFIKDYEKLKATCVLESKEGKDAEET